MSASVLAVEASISQVYVLTGKWCQVYFGLFDVWWISYDHIQVGNPVSNISNSKPYSIDVEDEILYSESDRPILYRWY